jgi:hypothetical protein
MRKIASAGAALIVAGAAFGLGYRLGGFHDGPSSFAPSLAEGAESRLAAILPMPDSRERARQLVRFFDAAGPVDAPEVRAAFAAAGQDVDEVAVVLFAGWWAEHHPNDALHEDLVPGWADLWIRTVVREWARRDPEGALRAIGKIPAERATSRRSAELPLIRGWFESGADPAGLLDFVEGIELGRPRSEALDEFAVRMLERDGIDASLRVAEAVPDGRGKFKLQFYRRFASALTSRDPQRAVAWAKQQAEGPYNKNLMRRIAARWGWLEGEAAMEWALALPDGEERDESVLAAYRSWGRRDRERASAWMRSREPTPALEPALALFIIRVARDDPEEALEWLVHIEDEERRLQTLASVGRRWMVSDPVAATAWLEGAGLPAEAKESILDGSRERVRRRATAAVDESEEEDDG